MNANRDNPIKRKRAILRDRKLKSGQLHSWLHNAGDVINKQKVYTQSMKLQWVYQKFVKSLVSVSTGWVAIANYKW